MSEQDLSGRAVVVTGAGGGIGRAVVEHLLARGADVLATDLPGAGISAVQDELEAAVVLEADVTSLEDWGRVTRAAEAAFGRLDGLVNNAGIEGAVTPLVEYPIEMIDRVLDINVKGVAYGMQALHPMLAADGGGAVVNVSSVAGLRGARNLSIYSASKHAVIGLTKSAAQEFAVDGVRVNAVCPSPIQTRMMRSLEDSLKTDGIDAEMIQASVAQNIPIGRYGEPTEVADLIGFLLSDASVFLSGAAIPIDGAMTTR